MKKLILITAVTLSILLLLSHSGVLAAGLMFLLTGIIPSTDYILPPITMFVMMAVGFWLLLVIVMQQWLRKQLGGSGDSTLPVVDSLAQRRRRNIKLS